MNANKHSSRSPNPLQHDWTDMLFSFRRSLIIAASAFLAACGGGNSTSSPSNPTSSKVFTTFQAADIVIGADTFATQWTGESFFVELFGNPVIAPDGKVYMPDWAANKIYIYDSVPQSSGTPTPYAVITNAGSAGNLIGPSTITFYDGKMILSDQYNNRVLIWNTPPTTDGVTPSAIIGGTNATIGVGTSNCSDHEFNAPESARVINGNLVVADSYHNRLMVYNGIPVTGASAINVLGQDSFTSCDSNGPGANKGLNYPTDILSDGQKIIVTDQANNRILMWNTTNPISLSNNPSADIILGQSNFNTVSSNAGSTPESGFNSPYFLTFNSGRLAVSDPGNNRILIWDTIPTCQSTPCSASFGTPVVLGQKDLASSYRQVTNDGSSASENVPSQYNMGGPNGVYFTSKDQLIVTDYLGDRLLVFNAK